MAIITCLCSHEYQDRTYGPWKRVANPVRVPAGATPKHRCTVCGKEQ